MMAATSAWMLKTFPVVALFNSLIVPVAEAATNDVIISVNLDNTSSNLYNLQFTSQNFSRFYGCMCGQRTKSCTAKYATASIPNVMVTSVETQHFPGSSVPKNYNYSCLNDLSKNSMVCRKLENVPAGGARPQSFYIVDVPCNTSCTTFYWFHENEKMEVNDPSIIYQRCGSQPSTISTTTPSTSPDSTNSSTTPESNNDDSSTGVIVGVIVAIIIIIATVAIVIGIIFWRRRHPPPKRQSWPNLEASSNNTTSLDDALNYRYRQHPAAAQEDTFNNNLHYGHDSNLQANHRSTDAVNKNNGIVEKHDYTEVDMTSKRGNDIVLGNISASGYDFADVPEEDKPHEKDGGKRVALVPGNKKKADDNGTGEDSDYSVIDDSEDKARQDTRGGSTAAGSTSLYSTAKTDDDFGYSTVKDNNQGKTPAKLNNTNKSQDKISTPQNTAYSLAGNTENTISKDSNSTTPHIYSTFHDDNSQPHNPYNVLPDADQDPQSEPPLSKPSSNPTNPNTQPSRYSMANPMLDASFDKTAGNSIEIITLSSSASK